MPTFTFDQILARGVRAGQLPGRTKEAREWYRNNAKKLSTSPGTIMKEGSQLQTRAQIGSMNLFFYDPKHKKTLPYYDTFPLIFKIKNLDDGFLGMNLHYLPLPLRAKLMDALYDLTTNKKFDETTKLQLSYEVLNKTSKFKWFKPTVKRYLHKHVRSRFLKINSAEWDIALMMPLERFEKSSKSNVWKESRKQI